MAKTRYYSADDPERGVTLAQLGRLGRERQREYILSWWARMFEDPAEETPYESAEGGYQWIKGGPYDALEELQDEFSAAISFERLEEFAREIEDENGIVDWAPGRDHPAQGEFYGDDDDLALDAQGVAVERRLREGLEEAIERLEAGERATFGSEEELLSRRELQARVEELEAFVASTRSAEGGIGHNQPPPDELAELAEAAQSVSEELVRERPDAIKIGEAGRVFSKFGSWLIGKLDKAVERIIGTGAVMAAGWTIQNPEKAHQLIQAALSATVSWLHIALIGQIPL